MSFNAEFFARQMKVQRAQKGWNQDDLAEVSGIAKGTIARWESCENTPGFDMVCKLADVFGCPTDVFWERKAS